MKHQPAPQRLSVRTAVPRRVSVRGKFLHLGDEKLYIRGVTYGTFAAAPKTGDFPSPDRVKEDFAAMARSGFNAVRVYIVPPKWLLDLALEHRLWVFVGLPWEQHIAFMDDPGRARAILGRLASELAPIAGHPSILAYAIGNEIPSSVVRWHGARRISRFLGRLAGMVRKADPEALITYVNFPTTEYLDLGFADFLSFNVYLEDMERLARYLARLQNIAGERPLLMAEIGLDSRRNGLETQAKSLEAQIDTVFAAGVAGAFVFAWTDEWHRSGQAIEDWDFGLVTRERAAKPALQAVSRAFAAAPVSVAKWPKISVVVCSFNGSSTIGETLDHLGQLDYPDYEVIVVNDGSTDATGRIADRPGLRLIETENCGLSNARNSGLRAARGEIVAYIDDDAYPDPHWLSYLALSFGSRDFAAVGGPNIAPPEDPDLAECVANAPGAPIHVLVDDEIAEHIPGCNMAFRRDALEKIGGFDARFRVAGDDVDACWRIEETGGTIGFSHAAVVWHHRRPSIGTYLKQQRGYARAEALLAEKWPNRYNRAGHLSWRGEIYGRGQPQSLFRPQHVYFGRWGAAPFQSVYQGCETLATAMPLMPEWYAITGLLLALGLLGLSWPPLLLALAAGLAALAISVVMAARGALAARFQPRPRHLPPRRPDWQMRAIVFLLYLLQPLNRLLGRIRHRLGPWSNGRVELAPIPRPRRWQWWTEDWVAPEEMVEQLHQSVDGVPHVVGGAFERWDLALGPSVFGEIRALVMVEEHGGGRQLFRLSTWPVVFRPTMALAVLLLSLALVAALSGAAIAALGLGVAFLALTLSVWTALANAARIARDLVRPAFLSGVHTHDG